MSHLSHLSPGLRLALMETSAAIPLPPNEAATATNTNTAPDRPLQQFGVSSDHLAERIERGCQAARNLIADPKPYKFDATALQRMVEAFDAIASSPMANTITIPAETYQLLAECVRAERARCYRRGEAWAVAETIERGAGAVAFEFSEVVRTDEVEAVREGHDLDEHREMVRAIVATRRPASMGNTTARRQGAH